MLYIHVLSLSILLNNIDAVGLRTCREFRAFRLPFDFLHCFAFCMQGSSSSTEEEHLTSYTTPLLSPPR